MFNCVNEHVRIVCGLSFYISLFFCLLACAGISVSRVWSCQSLVVFLIEAFWSDGFFDLYAFQVAPWWLGRKDCLV